MADILVCTNCVYKPPVSSSPLYSVSTEGADVEGKSNSCKPACVSDLFFALGRHLMAVITGSDITSNRPINSLLVSSLSRDFSAEVCWKFLHIFVPSFLCLLRELPYRQQSCRNNLRSTRKNSVYAGRNIISPI
jgi:hypothetical protein